MSAHMRTQSSRGKASPPAPAAAHVLAHAPPSSTTHSSS
eukprot:CAMPEP_0206283290 /NCGR_PEP_ID=MMETSP0047_2-20121206/40140_1 /ASSEMBLY_ACC=CAM_ASM_000192 /TAXON_ID=195065 /ORGANISM="Chroomonas mesostigmatica_cf, Strain CCMP1168" /LENGTH=38 /DNA_ID= /DNA_START= /DNA_END= /DNA_ORIENTATION=